MAGEERQWGDESEARKGGWHGVRKSLVTKHLSVASLQGKGVGVGGSWAIGNPII